jgi:protein-S-isoprenylcysteine O-methyltransferase Ste14
MNLARLSILGFVAAVAALVGLLYTQSLFGTEPISIGLQVAAALLMVWARATFGMRSFHAAANPTDGELVTHGPYGIVRNPIYAAAILFTWAGVAAHASLVSVALGLVVAGGMLARIFSEERMLRARYGSTYAEYEKRVKRLVPGVF